MTSADPIPALSGLTVTGGRLNVNNAIRVCPPISNPVPAATSIAPATAYAGGSAFTLTVNGTGFVRASEVRLNGTARATTFVSPSQLTASITANDIASVGSAAITVFNPAPGGGTSGVRTLTVATPPSITVNGFAGAILVQPGAALTVALANGPGNPNDWAALHTTTAADTVYQAWKFLNNTQTAPSSGLTNATLQFTAPSTPGSYNIRIFANGGYGRIATSATITVSLSAPPPPQLTISDVSVTEGNAGVANATFVVTLSPVNSTQTVTVNYATANGTATTADNDYTAVSGTLTFPPSVSTQSIVVPVAGDTTVEPDETFSVNLSSALNASISDAQGIGTITSDELPPTPAVTLQASTVRPGGTISFDVTNAPGNATDWVALHVTTAADTVYQSWKFLNNAQTAPATGLTNATLQFTAPQLQGTYNIRLFANGGYTRLATSATITVTTQAPPQPQLTINDVSVTEGNSGTVNATFTVTLSPVNATQSVTVNYATANGTATTANNDYTAVSGTLSFAPSVSTQTITVPIVGDTAGESNETFLMNLSGATNAVIGDAQGVGTIVTDDALPSPALTLQSALVAPGAIFSVDVTNGPGNTLDWVALHASGAADSSYLTWKFLSNSQTAPGNGLTTATLQFTAPTAPGTYNVRLFANGGYTKLAESATLTVSTQTQPQITINDVSITEGNSGTTNATFTVALSPINATQTVMVNYATANGTATAGSDYTAVSGTLAFAPSVATQTITVPVAGDAVVEANETFFVNLSGATNATIGDAQAVGTIVTDEAPAGPSLTPLSTVVAPGGTITFEVSNGPGNVLDWVALHATGAGDTVYYGWKFLNGTQSAPASGLSTATLQFTAPLTRGTYNIRLFANGGYSKLATSATITVQ